MFSLNIISIVVCHVPDSQASIDGIRLTSQSFQFVASCCIVYTQGENSICAFEVCVDEAPYFLDISPFSTTMPQQVIAMSDLCVLFGVDFSTLCIGCGVPT